MLYGRPVSHRWRWQRVANNLSERPYSMSATTDVLPGALWATRDTETTRPTSLTRALFGGFLIESVLLGSLGAIAAMAQVAPPPPEVIMQVEMPKPEVPPPPPPPPKEI